MSNAIGEPVSLEPLKQSRPSWLKLVKAAANAWVADYAPSMGAALSYYSVFSMAPLLLVVISIAGLVFGEDAVRGEVFGQLQSLLGADAAKAVQAILASVSDKPAQGVLSTFIGLAVLLIGATSVFGELQDALDRIWRAPVRDRAGGLWGLVPHWAKDPEHRRETFQSTRCTVAKSPRPCVMPSNAAERHYLNSSAMYSISFSSLILLAVLSLATVFLNWGVFAKKCINCSCSVPVPVTCNSSTFCI